MLRMGSIGSSLSASTLEALGALTQQIRQQQANSVQTLTAYVQDVPKEKITDARYIGDLRPNQNRLNAFSLSRNGDANDYYRFNLKSTGTVHLGMLVDSLDSLGNVIQSKTAQGLGIQVIQYQGSTPTVIADSDPNSGASHDLYTQLTSAQGAQLNAGKYVVQVYRQPDTSQTQDYYYSFQLVGGRYYQDYDTVQQPPPDHPQPPSILDYLTINPVVSMMAASIDPTMGAAMVAASQPPTLTTGNPDGTDPVTQLLNAFM
jgi:hypothetical protein